MAGKLDQKESEAYLDAFYEAGGNFVDTGASRSPVMRYSHLTDSWRIPGRAV